MMRRSFRACVRRDGTAAHLLLRPRRNFSVVMLDAGTLSDPLADLDQSDWDAAVASAGTQMELTLHRITEHGNASQLVERCRGHNAVLTNKVPVNAPELAELAKGGDLGVVVSAATGYNQIDCAAARQHGVTVCNVPGYSTPATAQHTVALLLALCNGVEDLSGKLRNGSFGRYPHFWCASKPTFDLHSATVGFVGWGQIARRVAQVIRGFEPPRVLAYSPSRSNGPEDWDQFSWATSPEQIFAECDVVLLHCPQTASTTGLVNERTLASMRQGSLLVNTARGGLVDEAALADALERRHLGGAAVDVLQVEPVDPLKPSPLMSAPNCIVTPHMACMGSTACRKDLMSRVLQIAAAWKKGEPINVVN
eukprot:TRINITY_DN11580_c2_g1_i1.p1 TRINITY_DN11580_c2_g1~~TRINITY_DN11580_c2_g1_i1.p1  ORF type:complete len:366 (+),score=80.21 TRINITY_DN11580_c2_g1_i1:79-1176(+)